MMLQLISVIIVFKDFYLGFASTFYYTIGWECLLIKYYFLLHSLLFITRPETVILETNNLMRILLAVSFLLCVFMGYLMILAAQSGVFALIFVLGTWASYVFNVKNFLPDGILSLIKFR